MCTVLPSTLVPLPAASAALTSAAGAWSAAAWCGAVPLHACSAQQGSSRAGGTVPRLPAAAAGALHTEYMLMYRLQCNGRAAAMLPAAAAGALRSVHSMHHDDV
jgi:hypothetical protein